MITVITGQPGGGKTACTVERFLMPLAAKDYEEPAIDPDGNAIKVKRRILTNINGLILDHEKIDDKLLQTWHEWVKPGDLIVYDEVQKPWPYTVMNKAQDKCITELETHRHYGIDMILITQHPMLVNSAIHRLAGQHLHVRRLGNSRFATIYEWDGVSRTLSYKAAFSKKPWRRSKEVEKVYRSSSLHTKQKRAVPSVLFGVLAAAGLIAYLGPVVYERIGARIGGDVATASPVLDKGAAKAVVDQRVAAGPAQQRPVQHGPRPELPQQMPQQPPQQPPQVQASAMIGCIRVGERCGCYDATGAKADKPIEYCLDQIGAMRVGTPSAIPESFSRYEPPRRVILRPEDQALMDWAHRQADERRRAGLM